MSTSPAESLPPGKYAETAAGVAELLRIRWSPRSFTSQSVSRQTLEEILDAARWAASSGNEQPWRFVVAKKEDEQAFQSLFGVLVPANQLWAKNAAVLILAATQTHFAQNGNINYYALHDVGAATAYLMLQAAASGLQAHAMAGFDQAKAREVTAVPAEFQIGAMIALGYPGSPDDLPSEPLQQRERAKRQRKPLSELVFSGLWGQSFVE